MEEKKSFLTIGHGKADLILFISILFKCKVNCVVDVRSSPYSKYSPQYNKEKFEAELTKYNIAYKWFGESLGGRPKDLSTYDEDGIVDYEKLVNSELFLKGVLQLEELSKTSNVAIMCSENDPLKCHRFLAISRELTRRGYNVFHIKDYKKLVKQSKLEDELIKIHFDPPVQLGLFSNTDDILSESYAKQNKLCGYRRK